MHRKREKYLAKIKELSKFDNIKLEELILLFSELENKVKFSSFPNILLETEKNESVINIQNSLEEFDGYR